MIETRGGEKGRPAYLPAYQPAYLPTCLPACPPSTPHLCPEVPSATLVDPIHDECGGEQHGEVSCGLGNVGVLRPVPEEGR